MTQHTYNTAQAMGALSKMYADKNITLIADGTNPRTDGKVIYLPSLPKVVTSEELSKIRQFIDHECGHIYGNSFEGKSMENAQARHGSLGKIVLNALEDARIEQVMSESFRGVSFDSMHEEFKSESLDTFTQKLIHALYLNSRHGWGHHPDCADAEQALLGFKDGIMRAHEFKSIQGVARLANSICSAIKNVIPPEQQPEQQPGQQPDQGDSTPSDDQASAPDQTDASDKSDGASDKSDGDKSDGDKSDGDKSDGDKSDGDKSDGDKSDGDKSDDAGEKSGGGDKSDGDGQPQPGDSEPGSGGDSGGGDGEQSQTHVDCANAIGNGGAGHLSNSIPKNIGQLVLEDASAEHASTKCVKRLPDTDGRELLTMEDLVDLGLSMPCEPHGPAYYARSGTDHYSEKYAEGSRCGSRIARILKAKMVSVEDTGRSSPRPSGQRVDRSSLAKFASGLTTRILTRDQEQEEVSVDVALLVDASGSLSTPTYSSEVYSAASVCRAIHMMGGKASVIAFGAGVTVLKRLEQSPVSPIKVPTRGPNTHTGGAMFKGLEELRRGSGKRKVMVVFTDGVPAFASDAENNRPRVDGVKMPTPAYSAMKACHAQGVELIVIPFGPSVKGLKDDIALRREQCSRYSIWRKQLIPFMDFMMEHGVFMDNSELESCPARVAKQIVDFKGDLGSFLRKCGAS